MERGLKLWIETFPPFCVSSKECVSMCVCIFVHVYMIFMTFFTSYILIEAVFIIKDRNTSVYMFEPQ